MNANTALKLVEDKPMSKYLQRDLDRARLNYIRARNMVDSLPRFSKEWKRAVELMGEWAFQVQVLEG